MQIAIAEAKSQFAELIRRAEAGEEVVLTRYGRPVARILAPATPGNALLGCMAGRFVAPDELPDADIETLFTDGPVYPD